MLLILLNWQLLLFLIEAVGLIQMLPMQGRGYRLREKQTSDSRQKDPQLGKFQLDDNAYEQQLSQTRQHRKSYTNSKPTKG